VHMRTRPRCPRSWTGTQMHSQQCASANASMCVHGNVLVRTSLLRCCAYNRFLSTANGREGRGEQLTVTPVPRTLKWASAAVETRCLPTVSIKQQLQRPANERVLLADLQVELRSHLSLLGNWQADQFTCIIHTPTLRGVIMVKIMRIINEFLWYITFNDLMLLISLIPF